VYALVLMAAAARDAWRGYARDTIRTILRRGPPGAGRAAVLPQHLPDRWLDALLEEADLLAPGAGDAEEGERLGRVLWRASWVPCSWSSWHSVATPDKLEVTVRHAHAPTSTAISWPLRPKRVSRNTAIWVEPPTLANIFDEGGARCRRGAAPWRVPKRPARWRALGSQPGALGRG